MMTYPPPFLMQHSRHVFLVAAAVFALGGFAAAPVAHAQLSTQKKADIALWQRGAIIQPSSPDEYAGEAFKTSLRSLAATNANYVTLLVPYYQTSVNTADIKAGWNTPTDEALAAGIAYAHSLDMGVLLRVTLDTTDGTWRSVIDPADRAEWFTAYGDMLTSLARLAEKNTVETLAIGTELGYLTSERRNYSNTANWKAMIAAVRKVYGGKLTYSAQYDWPDERNELQFWGDLDYIGIAGYHPLSVTQDKPSALSLRNSWEAWYVSDLKKISQTFGKPILLTDAGYRSTDNSHRKPWLWELTAKDTPDEQAQARNYEGLFTFWSDVPKEEFAGVHFWQWEITPQTSASGAVSYSPQNKAAQQVMTRWFSTSSLYAISYPSNRRPGVGEPVRITAQITNDAATPVENAVVQVAVFNGQSKVAERTFAGQRLPPASPSRFTASWTPAAPGTYTVQIRVLNKDMSAVKLQADKALTLTVTQSRAQRMQMRAMGFVGAR